MNIETNSIIAVVDGNGDHRAHTCGVLQRAGFHTWSAPSAEDFYVGLLSTRVDLVISELALPGKQGFHLVRRLAGQGIPSIILASSRGIESRIAGLKAGALQYFVKPVDMREVVAGVSSILNQVKHAKIPNPILNQREMPSWRLNPHTNCLIAPNLGMVPLTRNELALIDCLLSANTEVVSKAQLLHALGYSEGSFHRIDSQLTRLRRKTLQTTGMELPVRSAYGKGMFFSRR